MANYTRICTGCAVILADQEQESSFCSKECQFDFEIAEAYCSSVYRELDAMHPEHRP